MNEYPQDSASRPMPAPAGRRGLHVPVVSAPLFNRADAASASLKGRGTALQIVGRFEPLSREPVDDGWFADDDAVASSPQTRVLREQARSIITRNRSPDIFFDLSINPYRGCEHGCVYCYARPNHAYVGLSPGLDFETRLFAKENAAALFARELASARYVCEPINIGSVTDPYQPIERRLRITRSLLEVAAAHRQPVTLITKASLVERDIDLLAPMAAEDLAAVSVTVTSLDPELARRLEPRANAPWRRLETVRRLSSAGIPVGVSIGPLIPFINDHEIEALLAAAREAGAVSAFYTVIRLPWEVDPLFRQWLQAHYPERAKRVMHRIQDMRGGRDNDPRFHTRMRGEGAYAALIRMRVETTARRLGLDGQRFALRTDRFRPPAPFSAAAPSSAAAPAAAAAVSPTPGNMDADATRQLSLL